MNARLWLQTQGRWLLLGTWADGDVARVAPFERADVDVSRLFVAPAAGPG